MVAIATGGVLSNMASISGRETGEHLTREIFLRRWQSWTIARRMSPRVNSLLFYQKGAWRFSLYGMWMFAPAKYESRSFDNPIMNQTEQHIIKDNRRMLMLGVSYNFFSGKKKNIRKNINNYDSDAGAFK